MPIINAPSSTLQTIISKVRRITRTPSTDQLTDQEIGDYINTFVLYDMPDHLKLFDFKTTFTWYCNPYQDIYETDASVLPITDPLYNFSNLYISVHPPIYIAGYEAYYMQSREELFNQYPQLRTIVQIGTGDSVTTNFTGTLQSIPVLAGKVQFSSITAANTGLSATDVPNNPFDGTGNLIDTDTQLVIGTINYITGAYNITWATAPGASEVVYSQTVPYQPSRPTSIMYYDNKFTLRPVPDQPYAISMEVFKRPTALLDTVTSVPQLNEYWQYIAWGAAKKVFEDRMDSEHIQQLMPEFKQQEALILYKTVMQMKNERTKTIYTDSFDASGYNNFFGPGNF
jgi:hypothetical protein